MPDVIDPADLPPEVVGEVPPVMVGVPREARRYMTEHDVLGVAQRVVLGAFDEAVTSSTARMRASENVIEAARVWADGHPHRPGLADDHVDRRAKETDLLEAVREYEEVTGDDPQ